jgi:hypothetical protein
MQPRGCSDSEALNLKRRRVVWGWKAVERLVEPSVSFGDGKQILQQLGFQLHASNPGHAVFRRSETENPWTTLLPEGRNVPLELALAQSHSDLYFQLRYGTFALFDTGDLDRLADEIAGRLIPAESPAEPGAAAGSPRE